VEPAYQLRVSGVNEAGGLASLEHLNEGVGEEGILEIHLVHKPAPVEG
jgi:hypothetical protein